MGNAFTKDYAKHASKLEIKLANALKARAEDPGRRPRNFTRVCLAFPKIKETFSDCRIIFNDLDADKNGTIERNELKQGLHQMGLALTDEDVAEIFEEADMRHTHHINFREFLLVLAVIYLTRAEQPKNMSKEMQALDETLEVIADAFLNFDKNHDGFFTKNDMKNALNQTSSANLTDLVAAMRFEELDTQHHGAIGFKDFLYALESWAGIDEEEERAEAEAGESMRERLKLAGSRAASLTTVRSDNNSNELTDATLDQLAAEAAAVTGCGPSGGEGGVSAGAGGAGGGGGLSSTGSKGEGPASLEIPQDESPFTRRVSAKGVGGDAVVPSPKVVKFADEELAGGASSSKS